MKRREQGEEDVGLRWVGLGELTCSVDAPAAVYEVVRPRNVAHPPRWRTAKGPHRRVTTHALRGDLQGGPRGEKHGA